MHGPDRETSVHADAPGAQVSLGFDGKWLYYVFAKGPNHGIATVTIDGATRDRIDLYTPSVQWQHKEGYCCFAPGRHPIHAALRVAPARCSRPASRPELRPKTVLATDSLMTPIRPNSDSVSPYPSSSRLSVANSVFVRHLLQPIHAALPTAPARCRDPADLSCATKTVGPQIHADDADKTECRFSFALSVFIPFICGQFGFRLVYLLRVVVVRSTGEKNRASSGYVVDLDSFSVIE